ncbi:MAG: KpsF/GutQ family sugar-phosphate isomerase [Sphingobacteriia bacterium]|nr:KpsF/GutQ family sugar-phosphate isomerase [Sphingobacteriia bacterium]
MLDLQSLKKISQRVLDLEAQAILALKDLPIEPLAATVDAILTCKGRVVLSGIGKSAIIAQKISATLNSTGTPSLFMHAADAVHGDWGMVQPDDLLILVSQSGNSPEIKALLPMVGLGGQRLVAITGDPSSALAIAAGDYCLLSTVEAEACPHNLAPTTSTTVQMAWGDVLAVVLIEMRRFGPGDFARFHPGGALGKRLYLRVQDLVGRNARPWVAEEAGFRALVTEISTGRMGAAAVLRDGKPVGVVTDGDLRRTLESGRPLESLRAGDLMSPSPRTIAMDALAVDALAQMRMHQITQLLAVDEDGGYQGVVHLHDLLREGVV